MLGRTRLETLPRRRRGVLTVWLCLVAGLSVLALACAGASWGGNGYDAAADMNSMYSTTLYSGAQAWWKAGYTGKGVDVAVIDTGVSPVAGLDAPGKLIHGPDLSLESQAPNLTNLDTSGHGTFIAGLIAGRDAGLNAPYSAAPPSAYRGMAPDARILSLKVGTADGGVDVSQVIAAIDWVVEHRHDRGLDIRVLNLSYGTNSAQSAEVDPLSYAVEQAWKRGIVVVAAAGNSGYQVGGGAPGVADPAYNPFVIAAGGSDSMGTPALADDTVGAYSASARCGPCKRPDFVAPGSHLQGLRVPGSYIDQTEPQGAISRRFFRGTGTSEAAAIVSGAVALVLDRYPRLDPDDVKAFFKQNAVDLPGQSRLSQGRGEIDLGAMLADQPPRDREQQHLEATGTGLLEVARGQDHLTRDGVVLSGEQDIFGKPFDSAEMARLEGLANSWQGGLWNGSAWTGNSWAGNSWAGTDWAGNSWSGSSWSSGTWSGNSWSGNSWSGNSWSGNSWSGTAGAGTAGRARAGRAPLGWAPAGGSSPARPGEALPKAGDDDVQAMTTPIRGTAARRFMVWLGPARVWLFIAAVAALSAEVWAPILAHGGPPAAGGDLDPVVGARGRLLPGRGVRRPSPVPEAGTHAVADGDRPRPRAVLRVTGQPAGRAGRRRRRRALRCTAASGRSSSPSISRRCRSAPASRCSSSARFPTTAPRACRHGPSSCSRWRSPTRSGWGSSPA